MSEGAEFAEEPPASRIEQLFLEQARRSPAATAVLYAGAEVSYRELAAMSDRVAAALGRLGIGPGMLVGVCMRRTPRMIAALLGVLQAGGAYLPLDPAYPAERLEYMLADSRAPVLLVDGGAALGLAYAGAILDLRDAVPTLVRGARAPRDGDAPKGLAYVIYTSGSTGRPKGVMLGHGAVRLIAWAGAAFADGQLARVAATTSICFDPSVLEIFAPLCLGGTVILKPHLLKPFTAEERPALLAGVPSVMAELCRRGAVPDSVRTINLGGETLTAPLVREVYRRTRVEAVYNHYGPTEATTCAAVALARRDDRGDPPLGRAIAGARLFVLDPAGRRASPNEWGEIHIGGPGLALGYLHRPELTAERFRLTEHGRLYGTGDLGRWSDDGELRFGGRVDAQVKIRGMRVEPGEVEAALLRLEGVEQAAVLAEPDAGGRNRLVAYLQAPSAPALRTVRAALNRWLPEHMLPDRLVILERLPLTLSGKLDRRALVLRTAGIDPPRGIVADAAPASHDQAGT